MPSLYEKIKGMQPNQVKKSAASAELDILLRVTRLKFPYGNRENIGGETLFYLSNGKVRESVDSGSFLFLDTETTGLSGGAGTLAFLIGLGEITGDELVVTQLLMRDYNQEPLVLHQFLAYLKEIRCLVSYNGAGFDVPLLESRLTLNRLDHDLSAHAHIDMLYAARRVFKLRLKRCSLSRLEEEIFSETRQDDLPGNEVPRRYFQYLEHKREELLEDVLKHNCQDIVSLARLLFHVADLHEQPLLAGHQEDLFSLGKVYERHRQTYRAAECYRACVDQPVRDIAQLRLAEMYKRARMDEDAAQTFELLRLSPAARPGVYIALSKLYEHRFRQPLRALDIARQGMVYCTERLHKSGTVNAEYEDLKRRCLRLMRKVEKQNNGIS